MRSFLNILRVSSAIAVTILSGEAAAQTPQATIDGTAPSASTSYLNNVLRTSNETVSPTQGDRQQGFTPPPQTAQPHAGASGRAAANNRERSPISTGASASGRVIDMKLMDETFTDLRNSVQQDQPGVKRVDFEQGSVIPILLRQNAPVDIVLPEWESVEDPRDISVPVPWMVVEQTAPNALRVATKQVGYDGPLKVAGKSGTLYVFWVTVTGIRSAPVTSLPGARGLGAEGKALPDLMVIVSAPDPAPPPPSGRTRRTTVKNSVVQAPPVHRAAEAAPVVKEPDYAAMVAEGISPPLRALITDISAIKVPHRIMEKNAGDALAIGPIQVVEAEGFTWIDFGDDGMRPRPAISLTLDGIDRASANPMVHPDHPTVVIIDKIGSFTLTWEDRVVCIFRTSDPYGGLKEAVR